MAETLHSDVAVIGGSLGGVAAALTALEAGCSVVLSEATDWLGGQMTSQGVSALDEHPHIETFGATSRYLALRQRIRKLYQQRYGVGPTMPDSETPLNPGNGWVSRLCFEPKMGLAALEEMLEPFLITGQLRVLYYHQPRSASFADGKVETVTLATPNAETTHLKATYFLDATDLGELLPLTHTPYVSGAEARSDTGEAHAKRGAPRPDEVQGFTYSFAVEYCPGEKHPIPKPEGYEGFRARGLYSFTLSAQAGQPKTYDMFAGEHSFWRYRRIFDAALFPHSKRFHDLAVINWAGNDYHFANLIDQPIGEQNRIKDEAKRFSLGFLYWLQNEAPRDEGGVGYPELKLRKDVMATIDGLSKAPYIRESRRLLALERILEQDLSPTPDKGARARAFANSVGIGWYHMDLHPCVGNPHASRYAPTLPFQIPLGALIPTSTKNLLAACKTIGTTHLTNGAYRVHPVEWAIGEAAGMLAAFCCHKKVSPHRVWQQKRLRFELQKRLLARGAPLAWLLDIAPEHPLFIGTQLLVLSGAITPESPKFEGLRLELEQQLSAQDRRAAARAYQKLTGHRAPHSSSLADLAKALGKELNLPYGDKNGSTRR